MDVGKSYLKQKAQENNSYRTDDASDESHARVENRADGGGLIAPSNCAEPALGLCCSNNRGRPYAAIGVRTPGKKSFVAKI
jgi:hypothetical protein